MCMCANLEGQYHDESTSAPVDVCGAGRQEAHALDWWRLATAQHLCGALVGFINSSLVGLSLGNKKKMQASYYSVSKSQIESQFI